MRPEPRTIFAAASWLPGAETRRDVEPPDINHAHGVTLAAARIRHNSAATRTKLRAEIAGSLGQLSVTNYVMDLISFIL